MAGIFGFVRLDGGPADDPSAMAGPMARRGPEGTPAWREGPAALGHARMAATPEAVAEALPLVHAATGCAITADARLDNRDELERDLGIAGRGRVVGDGELILEAWLAWGEAALGRLLGDYAFAIWDPRSRRLVAARDPMGMRQVTYAHVPGRIFAFATDARAVLEAPGVPRALDEGRIADFLDGHETRDLESTFFAGVRRLPPGHLLDLGPSGLAVRRHFTLEPGPALRLDGDEAYAEALLEVFTEAVRARLRAAGGVGSMLSGGMDSGSVAAVAARLLAAVGKGPLPTFSAVGPDPASCVETRAIHAALAMPGLEPHLVSWADLDPWRDDLLAAHARIEDPFDGHMDLVRAAWIAARRAGVRVVLDGVGGDVVLARHTHVAWLLRQGRLGAAWTAAADEAAFFQGLGRGRSLLHAATDAFAPPALRRLRLRWWRARIDRTGWVRDLPGLARRVDVAGRRKPWFEGYRRFPTELEERRAAAVGPEIVAARERYDRSAAALGVEPRDPFLDLRVVRLALSLPMEQIEAGGWRKIALRRAMRGLLPDEVIWRRGKEHLGGTFTARLLWDGAGLPLSDDAEPLGGWIPGAARAGRRLGIDTRDQFYLRNWLGGVGQVDGVTAAERLAAWSV